MLAGAAVGAEASEKMYKMKCNQVRRQAAHADKQAYTHTHTHRCREKAESKAKNP